MKLILACDPTGGIGYNNQLPWDRLQGDLPRFKALTTGNSVLMGRNTWESLPVKPLPNRTNYVISSKVVENAKSVTTLDEVKDIQNLWVIGGAHLINSCWDLITEIHLSRTHDLYICDTYVDLDFISANFVLVSKEIRDDHSYEIWVKQEIKHETVY